MNNEDNQSQPISESLTERLSSESWKVRFDGLVDLAMELSSVDNEDIAKTYLPLLLKSLPDSQAWVQEKALDALLIIISRYPSSILPSIDAIVEALLETCLSSEKAIIKDKGMEAFMNSAINPVLKSSLFRILMNDLMKYKLPKVIMGIIQVLEQFMLKYNKAIFKLQDCIEKVNMYATNSTIAIIRDEAMEFYRIASRIFGKEIVPFIKELKPAQQNELRKICEDSVGLDKEVFEELKQNEFENFDEKWCENLVSQNNANDKCGKLQQLLKVVSNPSNGFSVSANLIKALQVLIDDENESVSEYALKAMSFIAGIAKGDYSSYYNLMFKPLVKKLMDIKTADEALRCLDSISPSIKFEEHFEKIKEALTNPSTTLRVNICHWLEHFLILPSSKSKLQLELVPILVKLMDESIAYLREKAVTCLTIIYLSLADPNVQSRINSLDKKIVEEILAASESVKLKYPSLAQNSISNISPQPVDEDLKEGNTEIEQPKVTNNNYSEANEILKSTMLSSAIPFYITETLSKPEENDKLMGLKDLSLWIGSNKEKTQEIIEPLATFLNCFIKNSKNYIIIKEVLNIYKILIGLPKSDKKLGEIVLPEVIDQMSEAEWFDPGMNIILFAGDCSGPEYIVDIVLNKLSDQTRNDNLTESGIDIVSRLLDEYDPGLLPLSKMFNCAKQFAHDDNPNVRSAAMSLLCGFQHLIGDPMEELLDDLDDEEFDEYDEQLSRCPPVEENKSYRKLRDESMNPTKKLTAMDAMNMLFPPADISSLISQKLINSLSSSSMRVRQDAKDQLQEIVQTTHGQILANGLNPLMNALKSRMSETSKGLTKGFIGLVGDLALKMGTEFKQYVKLIMPPAMNNLGDKQAQIRAETVSTINKVSEAIGPEEIINTMGIALERDSFEIRTELLNFILDHQDSLLQVECTNILKGVLCSLNDKSKDVKEKAESVLALIVPSIEPTSLSSAVMELKPAVQVSLKTIIEKYASTEVTQMLAKRESKPTSSHTNSSRTKTHTRMIRPRTSVKNSIRQTSTNMLSKASTRATVSGYKIIIGTAGNKAKRAEQDKGIKWNLDNVDRLKKYLKPALNSKLFEGMFSGKLNKQLAAATAFGNAAKTETEGIIDILDLLFKWLSILLVDQSNTAILKAMTELVTNLFNELINVEYVMQDFEANLILPLLCEKLSTGNTVLRDDIKGIILLADQLYPPAKVCGCLVKALSIKNEKTKSECLGILKTIVSTYGPKVITNGDIRAFGKLLSIDAQVRTECTDLLAEIYCYRSEDIWSSLNDLSDKNKEFLKERFSKTSPKTIPKLPLKVIKGMAKDDAQKSAPGKVLSDDESNSQLSPKNANVLEKFEEKNEPEVKKIPSNDPAPIPTKPPESTPLKKVAQEIFIEALTNIQSIEDCISALNGKENAKRVDALVFINGRATSERTNELAPHMNDFMNSFVNLLRDAFHTKELPIHLIKYLLDAINKLCKIKDLSYSIQRDTLAILLNELFSNMLIAQDNPEGKDIVKELDNTLTNMFENSKPNSVFRSLLEIYKCTKDDPRLASLVIKCLVRFMKKFDALLPLIVIPDLLVCFHEYFSSIEDDDLHTEIGARIIKTIVGKLVRAKRDDIWLQYKVIEDTQELKDVIIKRWITNMLIKTKVKNPLDVL